MEKENKKTIRRIGRKPKDFPAVFRYSINLNAKENARFLSLFEQSGMRTKARFIVSRVFGEEFKVLIINKSAVDYYTRLTTFYGQFRAIGVNYNQVVKELKTNFTEKKALALLFKLEKETIKLVELSRKIADLTEEFKQKYK